MTDPIAEAREILDLIKEHDQSGKGIQTNYPHYRAANVLPALLDEAEKWQAIATEGKCNLLMCLEAQKGVNLLAAKLAVVAEKKKYQDRAARELAAEAGNWREIGPDERKAIQWAIKRADGTGSWTDEDIREEYASVLRKLLEGLP